LRFFGSGLEPLVELIKAYGITTEQVILVGLAANALLTGLALALVILAWRRTNRAQAVQRNMLDRLSREAGVQGPIRAAVAALMVTDNVQSLSQQEVEQEIENLLADWDRVERVADDACQKVIDLERARETG
jgi:RNase P protein component